MKVLLTTLHSKYVHASLALPCLAAYCGKDCGTLSIEEFTVHEPKESVIGRIIERETAIVCFSVYLWNRLATLELVECLKIINPQMKIILGGPDISFESDLFFQQYSVDAIISGEGERPLRHLLRAWNRGELPEPLAGLQLPGQSARRGWSLLENLDDIPSPFAAGLVDLGRGLVYYESSRGCPYCCSFCMSALDDSVRSFSMERIRADLLLLMERGVPLIKFVDRTFNYSSHRTVEILSFILKHNRSSRFHFEIGAHLLDEQTLSLLDSVPEGVFQFEIGVQSTLPDTLSNINRSASYDRLQANVRRLVESHRIHLHLDLIAGLPGETYRDVLNSIDQVYSLGADHLQIELVKLLPGAPLRSQADRWGLRFDPNPPYTILGSSRISFAELERLRGIGRLMDLIVNTDRFRFILDFFTRYFGGVAAFLEDFDCYWRQHGLYHQSRTLRDLYLLLDDYLAAVLSAADLPTARDLLARDYAHHERVVSGAVPDFFNDCLTDQEKARVKQRVKEVINSLDRSGKIQYFAAAFEHLPKMTGRNILIFLYVSRTSRGMKTKEILL